MFDSPNMGSMPPAALEISWNPNLQRLGDCCCLIPPKRGNYFLDLRKSGACKKKCHDIYSYTKWCFFIMMNPISRSRNLMIPAWWWYSASHKIKLGLSVGKWLEDTWPSRISLSDLLMDFRRPADGKFEDGFWCDTKNGENFWKKSLRYIRGGHTKYQ